MMVHQVLLLPEKIDMKLWHFALEHALIYKITSLMEDRVYHQLKFI